MPKARACATSRGILALVLLALLGCSAPPPVLDAGARAAVEAEVESFLTQYREAFNEGDPETIAGLYVDDDRFALYEDGTLRYPSPQAIVDALAALPPGTGLSTEGDVTRVTPLTHDLATAGMTFRTRMSLPEMAPFTIEGVMTVLLERSEEKGWRVVQAHTSSVQRRGGA